jgi:hypothetical protein
MTMAFDTLRYSQRLQQVGVSREQAEAHAELARDMVIADLATKGDIAIVRSDLDRLAKELRMEMTLLEQRIVIKLGAIVAGAVAIIVAVQKLL